MLLHSRHLSRALLALLPLALCTDALFSKKGGVVLVNDKNFKQEVLNTEHAVIAKFYAPWCGHCKQFAPEFSLAAKNLTGLVKQVAIDCDEKDSAALCQRYEIKGFPTVKLFPGASSTADKNGKFANYKIPTDYRGGRTAKDLVKFALAQIPSFVKSISSNADGKKTVSIEDFLATKSTKGNDLPKAILFTNKAVTAPLFKALSVDFHDTVLLGEVRESEKDIVSQYGVKKFPTLLVFPEGGKEPVTYEGAIKHTDLFSFLAKYGVPVTPPKTGGEKGKASAKTEKAPEPFDPSIAQISTQENFESLCLKTSGTCILAFLIVEPDYPESVAAHEETLGLLSKLKTKLHNASLSSPFKFFWMDAISETKLPNDFRVADDRPALLALNNQRKLYRLFTGAFDEEGITQWLKETSAGKGRNFRYEFEPMMTEQKKKKKPTESKEKEEKKEKEKEKEVEKERKEEKEEKEKKEEKKEEEKEKVRDEL